MSNLLAQWLQTHTTLQAQEVGKVCSKWNNEIALKRHEFLSQRGNVNTKLYFVLQGTFHIYTLQDAEEVSIGFGYPQTILLDFPAFVHQQPTEFYIQAIKKSTLLWIGKADFQQLLQEIPALSMFWISALEQAVVSQITRQVDLLLPKPEDRITRLWKRNASIFQTIPHKYLASYLRMQPETFSRLLKNIDFSQV